MKTKLKKGDQELYCLLPNLRDCLEDYKKYEQFGYIALNVSVFDHWLSNEEAENQMPFDDGPEHHDRCDRRFLFLERITQNCLSVESSDTSGVEFRPFESAEERSRILRQAVYSEQLQTFCDPIKALIIQPGHDYTDYIYSRSSSEVEADIVPLISKFGLFRI